MIENIVRALIFKGSENKILLARQKDRDYTFLPGGHIEFGETARHALDREMLEEIGAEGRIGYHLWTIENIFTDAEKRSCHEIALYFTYTFYKRFYSEKVAALEDHLEMIWVDIDDLEFFNLKPVILTELIQKIVSGNDVNTFFTETESEAI
ncbi:MAG: NUDIX domain-containing protein [Candidatus Delongbacteria bacterium]